MPKAKRPTQRDTQVLEAIRSLAKDFGPSRRELCHATGFSYGTVAGSIGRLRRFGFVTWNKGIARSLRLTAAT